MIASLFDGYHLENRIKTLWNRSRGLQTHLLGVGQGSLVEFSLQLVGSSRGHFGLRKERMAYVTLGLF